MNYTNLDIQSNPDAMVVYGKPRYILGKATGAFVQFYMLSEANDGQLKVQSTKPRTIPASVFNATFVKIGDLRGGGIFIKTPEPAHAIRADEPGALLSRDIETGQVIKAVVNHGDFIVSRKSGMIEALDPVTFNNRYTEVDPRNLPIPGVGDNKQSDITLS